MPLLLCIAWLSALLIAWLALALLLGTFLEGKANAVAMGALLAIVPLLAGPGLLERFHVNKMKKYLNFVGQSVDPNGAFLHDMRRAQSAIELFSICDRHLLTEPAREFSPEPYAGVIARPNCETPTETADGCSLETVTA